MDSLDNQDRELVSLDEVNRILTEEEYEQAVLNLVNGGMDVVSASKMCGVDDPESFASELMRKESFIKAVEDTAQGEDLLVKSKKQRQRFWGRVMSDEHVDPRSRLRASELLAKSESDFVDNINVTFSPEVLLKRIEEEYSVDISGKEGTD